MHMVQTLSTGPFCAAEKPRTINKWNKALFVMVALGHNKRKDSQGFQWEQEPTTIAVFPCLGLETLHGFHLMGFVMRHKKQAQLHIWNQQKLQNKIRSYPNFSLNFLLGQRFRQFHLGCFV